MMSYQTLENCFYRSEVRTISATLKNGLIRFTASTEDMALIDQLSEADRLQIYNLVIISG